MISSRLGLISFFVGLCTVFQLTGCGGGSGSSIAVSPPPPQATATPSFSPPGGSFIASKTVSLADATPGSTIYYTLDGSTPSANSLKYTSPIALSTSATINAIAVANGYTTSPITRTIYTLIFPGPIVSAVQSSSDLTQLFAAQPGVEFLPAPTGTSTNPVYVDETRLYQPIEGFGAAFTETAAYILNEVATPAAHTEAVNNLFTRNGMGIGLSFMRATIGASDFALSVYSYDDLPAGETDPSLAEFSIAHDQQDIIPLIQEAKTLNPAMKLVATPWSPPGWMKSNGSMIRGGTLQPADYSSFANYLVKYIQAYGQAGIPIDYLTIQNEPGYEVPYPSMALDASTATTVLSQYVLPALAANNIPTKVLLLDSDYFQFTYPLAELTDPTINSSSQVAGVAWHGYGPQQSHMQLVTNQYPNLGQYMTEHSGFAGDPGQFKNDFEDITAVMRDSGRTFLKWSLATNEDAGPVLNGCEKCGGMVTINDDTGTLTYPPDFFTIGHFSKYILPGATRIFSSNAQGILSSAFINADGSKVLVAFNDTSSPQAFQVVWGAYSFNYTLPAVAAATFTWDGIQSVAVNVDATRQIQASSFDALSNLRSEYCGDTNGGYNLSFASDGSWAVYKGVSFGASTSSVSARVENTVSGASIEFHLDSATGPLVATVQVPNTGGWENWKTVTAPAIGASGVHDLYVVFRNVPSKLNWFQFK